MAQFQPALDFLLNNEDRDRQYAIVADVGGHAIAGINSSDFPVAYIGIADVPQNQRAPLVAAFYQGEFWVPMQLGSIWSQDVANRVLDAGVNMGMAMAAKLLQEAINATMDPRATKLAVDGRIGPQTIDEANSCAPTTLLEAFRQQRLAHYEAIVAAKPEDAQYLPAWRARALA